MNAELQKLFEIETGRRLFFESYYSSQYEHMRDRADYYRSYAEWLEKRITEQEKDDE